MRVCVTGSTGFVGQGVVPALLEAEFEVHALARPTSILKIPIHPNCTKFEGEALDVENVTNALAGCTVLIHLVGARRKQLKAAGLTYEDVDVGSVRIALAAMEKCDVKRIVLLSAAAIGDSLYVQSKAKVEQLVKDANVAWTILRPSFILGPGEEWPLIFSPALAALAAFPGNWGRIARLAQNITREELAATIVYALRESSSIGKIFDVPAIREITHPKFATKK